MFCLQTPEALCSKGWEGVGRSKFYLAESLKSTSKAIFWGGFQKVVCEANSDAGSETQGCRQSNAGNGIETENSVREALAKELLQTI